MKTQEKPREKDLSSSSAQPPPTWHEPEELRDRLNQPKVTYEEALAQTRRMMNPPLEETLAPASKSED